MQHRSTCSCSRRSFLHGCGLTLTGFGVASLFPSPLINYAMAGVPGLKRLMFIFLRGGNDGVNCVIPHGDPDYNTGNRPTLHITPGEAIDLGNGFASLHPSMAELVDVFNAGDLAIVHRVGYPGSSRSHFDGQRIWENGNPANAQDFRGWLASYIAENAVSAGFNLPVLSVQPLPPVLLSGPERFVNIANPDDFDYGLSGPRRNKATNLWRGLFSNLQGLEAYRPILSQTGVKLMDTLDEYASWDQANWDPKDPDDPARSLFPVSAATNQAGFSAASYEFFNSLKVSALSLLESDGANNNGTRIAGTQLGGWDTHNGQGRLNGDQPERLSWLAYGIRSLRIVLSGAAIDPRSYTGIWNDTAVVTLSEFGRTTIENGSAGTDHAAASCLFVAGGSVNGGLYNCDSSTWPSGVMFGVDGRYLLERTDYRAIFWELLRDHMGAAPQTVDTIFPQYTQLGLSSQELGLF